jgi:hypothetical protein
MRQCQYPMIKSLVFPPLVIRLGLVGLQYSIRQRHVLQQQF